MVGWHLFHKDGRFHYGNEPENEKNFNWRINENHTETLKLINLQYSYKLSGDPKYRPDEQSLDTSYPPSIKGSAIIGDGGMTFYKLDRVFKEFSVEFYPTDEPDVFDLEIRHYDTECVYLFFSLSKDYVHKIFIEKEEVPVQEFVLEINFNSILTRDIYPHFRNQRFVLPDGITPPLWENIDERGLKFSAERWSIKKIFAIKSLSASEEKLPIKCIEFESIYSSAKTIRLLVIAFIAVSCVNTGIIFYQILSK